MLDFRMAGKGGFDVSTFYRALSDAFLWHHLTSFRHMFGVVGQVGSLLSEANRAYSFWLLQFFPLRPKEHDVSNMWLHQCRMCVAASVQMKEFVRFSSLGQSLTFFTHSGIFDLTELRVVETTSRFRRDFRRVVDSRHRLRREGYSCVSFSLNSFAPKID